MEVMTKVIQRGKVDGGTQWGEETCECDEKHNPSLCGLTEYRVREIAILCSNLLLIVIICPVRWWCGLIDAIRAMLHSHKVQGVCRRHRDDDDRRVLR